jgi:hypothetical protein
MKHILLFAIWFALPSTRLMARTSRTNTGTTFISLFFYKIQGITVSPATGF